MCINHKCVMYIVFMSCYLLDCFVASMDSSAKCQHSLRDVCAAMGNKSKRSPSENVGSNMQSSQCA
jgi:hypothetical protein